MAKYSFRSSSRLRLLLAGALGWLSLFAAIAFGFRPPLPKAIHQQQRTMGAASFASGKSHNKSLRSPILLSSFRCFGDSNNDDGSNVNTDEGNLVSRRSAISGALGVTAAVATTVSVSLPAFAAQPNGLILKTAETSGLRWVDAKIGTGETPSVGSTTSIDYSMASTAGRFPSIYSTKNGDEPYRWKLGDGSTIQGIEMAILGDPSEGIPPMRPGGIRRVIVPNNLGYNALIGRDGQNNNVLNRSSDPNAPQNLSAANKNKRCLAGSEGSLGPIPPKDAPDGAYQRWYQFYCNPRIPYQPDLVLDIKLFGARGSTATTASVSAVQGSQE